jgi:hypothetical protein
MSWFRREVQEPIRGLPVVPRHAAVGALLLGGAGAVAGLVVGLLAYPPTAVVAIFEVGVPAAVVGALLGSVSGCFALFYRRVHQWRR